MSESMIYLYLQLVGRRVKAESMYFSGGRIAHKIFAYKIDPTLQEYINSGRGFKPAPNRK